MNANEIKPECDGNVHDITKDKLILDDNGLLATNTCPLCKGSGLRKHKQITGTSGNLPVLSLM